tara:strand:+ start:275 stop:898 length:624 start_codon:yes stop_codon:yes gene_type:complete
MSTNIKHVGVLSNTGKKVVVVFRELPDDPSNCLVVDVDALPDWMHDDIINAVEEPGAQNTANFYEYAERKYMADGTNMLQTLHSTGRLNKQPTDNVKMTPNNSDSVGLTELNNLVRENNANAPVVSEPLGDSPARKDTTIRNVVEDIAQGPAGTNEGLDDTAIAKSLLAQAKGFEVEAKNLKAQAYEMVPGLKPGPKKPAAKVIAEA